MAQRLSNKAKLKSLITVTSSAVALFGGISFYQGNERFYNEIVIPLTQLIDPEIAHNLAVKSLKWGFVSKQTTEDPSLLQTTVLGLQFKNPIGMAAGFDKQGEAVEGLHKIGFSFVEIGSVTPKAQPGNPKPRVFRLPEDNAIVNRYGFNSDGHDVVWKHLKKLKEMNFDGIIGVNLGKNKETKDAIQDYIDGIKRFMDVADYFVINISSPNTPGLRSLQKKKNLEELLTRINAVRELIGSKQPLLLKLAPDLSDTERQDVADVILKKKSKVDGLILCNTTITRPNLSNPNKEESGGLSGAPLADISTAIISDMYRRTHGSIPIIGVGGIFSGADAYVKIKAGASLVQLYTSYVYNGPPIVGKIKKELCEILETNGFSSVADAVECGFFWDDKANLAETSGDDAPEEEPKRKKKLSAAERREQDCEKERKSRQREEALTSNKIPNLMDQFNKLVLPTVP